MRGVAVWWRVARSERGVWSGRIAVLTVISGLLFGLGVASAQEAVTLDRVESLLNAGRVQEARELLARWQEGAADSADAETRAWGWYLAGRLAEDGSRAELDYLKVVIEGSNSPYADDALLRLAEYQFARGEYDRGIDYLARLRRDYPTSEHAAEALLWMARGALSKGDRARACSTAEQGLNEVAPADTALAHGLSEIRSVCVRGGGDQTVQVAALRDVQAARDLAGKLRARGFDAWITGPSPSDSLVRVRVGRGLGATEAQALMERLMEIGYSPFLVRDSSGAGGGP